ncbi:MAG: Mrp/NBP35 family ATP-binding protein [Clostridiaceae bacterium]|nr:Mrp/NBP35 family ATP-binding protein [Clostridiales bacterium]MDD6876427.1 Mrp/NBP35 family ATP-binding protein [Clostridiaceae bacterium]MDY3072029.1 Mrp/NBP35 family ATP-binding protein [Eubacteriales bacterium]MDY5015624.1 Mrp/NBP35 family ATP-binding protein [Eubacteriales bacterium]
MSEECTHDCSTCSQHCGHANPEDLIEKLHPLSSVKHVYGVVSGKGGVGKSIVTSMLAASIQRQGYRTAILDADITGPSIPKMFGVKGPVEGIDDGILAKESKFGTQIMSVNLLLDEETRPVVWRGPVIAGTVKQFWTEVVWKDVDYMFVDMPPGTGDVPLTVFQSLPIEGIFIVTSPQELVSMVVAKAVNMANLMNVPIVGLIENMSYFKCPDCGKEYKIFGDSHISEIADANGLDVLARIPIDPELAKVCDAGAVELFEGDYLAGAVTRLLDGKK